jgi:hypothetical protein
LKYSPACKQLQNLSFLPQKARCFIWIFSLGGAANTAPLLMKNASTPQSSFPSPLYSVTFNGVTKSIFFLQALNGLCLIHNSSFQNKIIYILSILSYKA